MKNSKITTTVNGFVKGTLLATALFIGLQSFAASDLKAPYSNVKNEDEIGEVSLKHVGFQDDNILINLNIDNYSSKEVMVSIKDEEGIVLFSKTVNSKNYNQTFAISNSLDLNKIRFVVENKNGSYKKSYGLNVKTVEVVNMVVR